MIRSFVMLANFLMILSLDFSVLGFFLSPRAISLCKTRFAPISGSIWRRIFIYPFASSGKSGTIYSRRVASLPVMMILFGVSSLSMSSRSILTAMISGSDLREVEVFGCSSAILPNVSLKAFKFFSGTSLSFQEVIMAS